MIDAGDAADAAAAFEDQITQARLMEDKCWKVRRARDACPPRRACMNFICEWEPAGAPQGRRPVLLPHLS